MRFRFLPALLGAALLLPAACSREKGAAGPTGGGPNPDDPVEVMVGDMTPPHEGSPHGVPLSYDWARGPRVGMGNDPGAFRAMILWGQVYEAAEGNPSANTRVHLRDAAAWVLSKRTRQWRLVQSSVSVEGSAYREDFAGDVNRPADVRAEPDGGVSVTAGGGYNYHFWPPSGRAAIDPNDIGGVVTRVRARLVSGDTTRPDDRAAARYLLSVGGDYWLSRTAAWDNFKTNGDIGIGKFKYVGTEWKSFYMTTLSADSLRANPPPVE
jgi:hypothetical protein